MTVRYSDLIFGNWELHWQFSKQTAIMISLWRWSFLFYLFIYIYIYKINFPFTRTQQVWDGIIQKQVFPRKDQNITTVSDYCLCPSIEDVDKFPIYFLC